MEELLNFRENSKVLAHFVLNVNPFVWILVEDESRWRRLEQRDDFDRDHL